MKRRPERPPVPELISSFAFGVDTHTQIQTFPVAPSIKNLVGKLGHHWIPNLPAVPI